MWQARPEMEALMEYMKEEQARGNTEAAVSRAGPARRRRGPSANCYAVHAHPC